MKKDLVAALVDASNAAGTALAPAALVIARVENPRLDAEPYIARLDAMGDAARRVMERHASSSGDMSAQCGVKALNEYLFEELGFTGNRDKYEDPTNSCLNEVLERRTGIPLTLSIVYMEVAQRAGLQVDGINFPGHFLVRCPQALLGHQLVIDPFHSGALLSEHNCRLLLQKHVGSEVAFSRSLLQPATRNQILVRMLLNLKRIYVHMRSFPQARDITELLLSLTPSALERAARSRPARLPVERRHRRAARPAGVPEALEHERTGQRGARRAPADLGARQDAPSSSRRAQLEDTVLRPWALVLGPSLVLCPRSTQTL